MIETFVRLVDGRNEVGGTSSLWQGILRFQTNVSINQLVVSTIQQAGRAASDIDPQSQNWRFLLFNHKFGEYCDTNSRDKRAVCDGDKFQLVFVPKKLSQLPQNGWISASQPATSRNRATAEIQNQTPLIFLDEEDEDVKPSIDTLIRATINAANQAIIGDQNGNGREIRRGSTRHLPTDLVRMLEHDFDDEELEEEDEENSLDSPPQNQKLMRLFQQENDNSVGRKRQRINLNNNNNNNDEEDSEEDPVFKPKQAIYRRNSSIVSEKSINGNGQLEDGPCSVHLSQPDQCSHMKFKNVDALGILGSVSTGQSILEHLESLSQTEGTAEIEHGIRCKLMNAIGTYLMHNADTVGLPTAVERRILVHSFLSQLPCQIEPSVFTNRGGTGCLDYWVRNRRKTTVREDGVYMVRGSKNRTTRGGKRASNY